MKILNKNIPVLILVFLLASCVNTGRAPDLVPSEETKQAARDRGEPVPTLFASPVYPSRAYSRGVEGHVVLEFDVLRNGTTTNIKVVEAEPSEIFSRSAIEAIKNSTYEPISLRYNGVRRMLSFKLGN